MSSAIPAQRLALVDLLRGLYPDGAVTYGPPVDLSAQMAYINRATIAENGQPTTSGAAVRSRRETSEIEVVLSCYVPGNPGPLDDAQQSVCESAYAMYDALEDHFRGRDNAPLTPGSFPSVVTRGEDQIYPAERGGVILGWICDVTATVTTTANV